MTEIGAMRHARGAEAVAVIHCTHGLNRTGFLLVYTLCALDGFSLAEALTTFGQVRPPGLWREQYVHALHDKFGGVLPPLPPPPEWEADREQHRR
jgi:mRNA-capping enzyme